VLSLRGRAKRAWTMPSYVPTTPGSVLYLLSRRGMRKVWIKTAPFWGLPTLPHSSLVIVHTKDKARHDLQRDQHREVH
jgi:hypothetical protein